jgi:para-nitrobenzyl esterase
VKKQAAIGQPAYLYLFDHGFPAADSAGLHGFHASEVPFVFGTLDRTPAYWPKAPATAEQARLSDAMLDYWSSFASSAQPVASGGPAWPAYGSSGAAMVFQQAPQAFAGLFPGMYALHEAVVCRRRAQGDIAWNWNMGIVAPPLPPKAAGCD